MDYNEEWRSIEEAHDAIEILNPNKILHSSLSGLSLSDFLVIRNWIDYAKGIGDPTAHLLNPNDAFSEPIYTCAKSRAEIYSLQASV